MYNPLDELGSEVERAFTFENGDRLYVDYDEKDNILFAGHATNAGVMKEVKIQYDKDDTLYENLERLHEACIEDDPSRLDEEKVTDSKETKKGVVVNVGKKDSLKKRKDSASYYVYQFPPLTEEDKESAKDYNLTILGYSSDGDTYVRGTLRDIKDFADESLGYVLVDGYLWKEKDFDGVVFEDSKTKKRKDSITRPWYRIIGDNYKITGGEIYDWKYDDQFGDGTLDVECSIEATADVIVQSRRGYSEKYPAKVEITKIRLDGVYTDGDFSKDEILELIKDNSLDIKTKYDRLIDSYSGFDGMLSYYGKSRLGGMVKSLEARIVDDKTIDSIDNYIKTLKRNNTYEIIPELEEDYPIEDSKCTKKDNLRRKAKDENHKLSAEEVAMTKAIYVRTPEDKEVWNSLTEEEKWLLRMSADQGFWWDLEDKDKERVNRLERKFSSFKGLSDGKKTKDSGKWTFVILKYNDNPIYESFDTYNRKSEAEDAATEWIADLAFEVEYGETEDGWTAYYDNGNIEIASGCETREEAEKLVDEWIDGLYYEIEKSTYDGKRNTKDEIIAGIDDWVIKEVIDKVRDIDDKGGVVEYKRMMDFIKSLSEDLSEFDCHRIYNYIRNKYDSGKIWEDRKPKGKRFKLKTSKHDSAKFIVRRLRRK